MLVKEDNGNSPDSTLLPFSLLCWSARVLYDAAQGELPAEGTVLVIYNPHGEVRASNTGVVEVVRWDHGRCRVRFNLDASLKMSDQADPYIGV